MSKIMRNSNYSNPKHPIVNFQFFFIKKNNVMRLLLINLEYELFELFSKMYQ